MSWEYFLVPRESGARFDDDVLARVRDYWSRYPIYHNSRGVLVLAPDFAYRDAVVADGTVDEPRPSMVWIALSDVRIIYETHGNDQDALFADFAEWFLKAYPAKLISPMRREISVADFRRHLKVPPSTG